MLDPNSKQGHNEFIMEVLMLSFCRNKNLVELYGYCCEEDQRSLVYEYMPLGSVEDNIHSKKQKKNYIYFILKKLITLSNL